MNNEQLFKLIDSLTQGQDGMIQYEEGSPLQLRKLTNNK